MAGGGARFAAHFEVHSETGIAVPLHECVQRCEADWALRPLLVVPQRADQLVDLAQCLTGKGLDRVASASRERAGSFSARSRAAPACTRITLIACPAES